VGRRNTRAIHFYERVGFQRVFEGDGWIGYGMKLED
jgi:ribosomal protein S18 acetylase RimI-like enzyme